MSDGFFDMPAGYTDADLEMAALEERGRIHYQRYTRRGITSNGVEILRDGGEVTSVFRAKDTGAEYEMRIRAIDVDEFGPCTFRYSCDGLTWHDKAKDARLAA